MEGFENSLDIFGGFGEPQTSVQEILAQPVTGASLPAVPAREQVVPVARYRDGSLGLLPAQYPQAGPNATAGHPDDVLEISRTVETKTTYHVPRSMAGAAASLFANDSPQNSGYQENYRASGETQGRGKRRENGFSIPKHTKSLLWAAATLITFESLFALNNGGELGTPGAIAQAHFGPPSIGRLIGYTFKSVF